MCSIVILSWLRAKLKENEVLNFKLSSKVKWLLQKEIICSSNQSRTSYTLKTKVSAILKVQITSLSYITG